MQAFAYTKASWDKARPALLKSTGLGQALSLYEKEKESLKKHPGITGYHSASEALKKVEIQRLAAVKECGKLFKGTADYLETADKGKAEKAILAGYLAEQLKKYVDEKQSFVKNLLTRLKFRKTALEKAHTGLEGAAKLKPGSVAPNLPMSKAEFDWLRHNLQGEGDDKSVESKQGYEELREALNPKYGLKNSDILKPVLDKCKIADDEEKTIKDLKVETAILTKEIVQLLKTIKENKIVTGLG